VVTDAQLYLAIGLPTLSVLVGILVNGMQFGALNARMNSLESRLDGKIDALESKIDSRITNLENKFDTRFDLLLSKVIDIDNRLTRFEAQRH